MGLTLREGNREYFYEQLDRLFPNRKEQYMRFDGNQYIIESPNNNRLMNLLIQTCRQHGIVHDNEQIFQYLQTFEEKDHARQVSLLDVFPDLT